MSLSLLKRSAPKTLEEESLPVKRNRSVKERYNELIQEEIDKRLSRPQKKKTKKESKQNTKAKKPLLQVLEEKKSKIPVNNYERNLKILQKRTLPDKYLKLLSKKS